MIEREWREASDLRTSKLALAAVLAVAIILRFWALGRGIPYAVQVDEPELVERAFGMMRSGSLNPHFYDYPGLSIYLQLAVSIIRFITGAIVGTWQSLGGADSADFYLWGRALTALVGVANVLLVFQIAMRWGARHALLAAGLLAVNPLHVQYSHFVVPDTLLTFFVTLTLLLSLAASERNTLRSYALAGAAAGLAAATKYDGGIALLLPLIACWMSTAAKPSRLAAALAACAACVAVFLIAAPYTLLDLPGFLDAFAKLTRKYQIVSEHPEAAWLTYLKYLARRSFGWPALLLAIAGMILGIVRVVRGPGRIRWALVTTFPLIYSWIICGQYVIVERYLLPIVPMLCILAATAVVSGVSLLRRYEIPRAPRTALIAALTIVALLPPTLNAIAWDRDAARQDTADLAYAWMVEHIPQGAKVVLESTAVRLPARTYSARNVAALRLRDYTDWRNEGIEYLVASSQVYEPILKEPQKYPREYAQYMRIFEQSREVARFTPSNDHPGPELRIYKVIP